jgi:hypothetical protein
MDPDRLEPPSRPQPGEYLPYFAQYIDLVPDGDLLATLARQVTEVCAALGAVVTARVATRPAPAEWSSLDIAVHLADTERVLAFRAFTFARTPGAELPGVDFELMAESARANARHVSDVISELRTVRAATLALLGSLGPGVWANTGTASGSPVSVRALAYIIAGHDLHHLPDLHRGALAASDGARDGLSQPSPT